MNIGAESETMEFEEDMTHIGEGVLSLTSMLNRSNGGSVFFGVDDDGDVIGVTVGDSLLMEIEREIRINVQPHPVVSVDVHTADDGKQYVEISAKGSDIPYSYDGRFYVRNGLRNEVTSPDLVMGMGLSGYDAMREMPSHGTDLMFVTLCDLMISRGFHPRQDRDYLDDIGLLTKGGEFNLNAEVLSDSNGLILQVVEFDGITRSRFVKRTDFGGRCMFMAMRMVMEHVMSRSECRIDVSSGVRVETPLFDIVCFREAWLNACLHNSWRVGIPPSVSIFDDRMEVQSTGTIPYNLRIEDFHEGHSEPVNESLYRLAESLGFTEHIGRGIPAIVGRYGLDAIRITDGSVAVIIPFAFEPSFVLARRGSGVMIRHE